MRLYLAGENGKYSILTALHNGKQAVEDYVNGKAISREMDNNSEYDHSALHPYVLESFYYANEKTERYMRLYDDVIIDSGAFTFMGGFSFTDNSKGIVFEDYIEQYADFIVRNNIEKFFELDVDSVVGYSKVLEYRRQIERLTQRQCIPVWHSTRGIAEFTRMCEEYPYVALGGIVGGEWKSSAEKAIPWFIREAHKHNAKIHGLGYTKLKKLEQYHFDSVDSTAWTSGNRFGHIWKFNGKTMIKINPPKGYRIKESRRVAVNNWIEWTKFQRYADVHL